MNIWSSMPFRIFLLGTFFLVLIGGFVWYMAVLQYKRDTAHLQFVNPDNEVWTRAKERASASWDTFLQLYPQYPQNSFVKFTHDGPSGFREDIWAKVTAAGTGYVAVTIEPQYLKEKDDNPQKEIPLTQALDWMVELPSGKIRGGYTAQALLLLQLEQATTENERHRISADLAVFQDKL